MAGELNYVDTNSIYTPYLIETGRLLVAIHNIPSTRPIRKC